MFQFAIMSLMLRIVFTQLKYKNDKWWQKKLSPFEKLNEFHVEEMALKNDPAKTREVTPFFK